MLFSSPSSATEAPENVYGFTFHALTGHDDIPLEQFRGKVILIVNTASQCGFTGQYEGLEKLYQAYADRGLVVLGVPSNDFGQQEPGTSTEIANFCKINYGVSFPMASKEVVTGDNAHPFYQWARTQKGYLASPKWNFHKYLINRQGVLVDYFHSTTKPDDKKMIAAIEQLL
jgi:glutathione peroxidase